MIQIADFSPCGSELRRSLTLINSTIHCDESRTDVRAFRGGSCQVEEVGYPVSVLCRRNRAVSGRGIFNPAVPVFGTQIAAGSRFVETLLSAIETCRQQGRDVFAWVTVALQSHFAGQPCPPQ